MAISAIIGCCPAPAIPMLSLWGCPSLAVIEPQHYVDLCLHLLHH